MLDTSAIIIIADSNPAIIFAIRNCVWFTVEKHKFHIVSWIVIKIQRDIWRP